MVIERKAMLDQMFQGQLQITSNESHKSKSFWMQIKSKPFLNQSEKCDLQCYRAVWVSRAIKQISRQFYPEIRKTITEQSNRSNGLRERTIWKTKNIWKWRNLMRIEENGLQEKTSAAAAPRKPKKGAVSSPLNVDMSKFVVSAISNLKNRVDDWNLARERERERETWISLVILFIFCFDIFRWVEGNNVCFFDHVILGFVLSQL